VRTNRQIVAEISEQSASRFDPQKVVPWSALFLSICSVIFAVVQGIFMMHHNELSVTPSIEIFRFNRRSEPFGVLVRNNGVGPAVIKKFEILYLKNTLPSLEKVRNLITNDVPEAKDKFFYTDLLIESFLPANRERYILSGEKMGIKAQETVWDHLGSEYLQLRITYCSVYNKCYVACLHDEDCH
jgi:hypothetical protein